MLHTCEAESFNVFNRPRSWLFIVVGCSSASAPITNGGQTATPPGDAALALFDPAGRDCTLARVEPLAKTSEVLARFPHACTGARIAWRADRKRAVAWFDPGTAYMPGFGGAGVPRPGHPIEQVEIKERLYDVDLVAHAVAPLDVPEHVAEAAYGADGTLYAFTELDLPNAKGKVTVRGTALDFTGISEGMPAAALAFARRGGRWELTSVTATTTGWDYARGWSAAPEAAKLGPRSVDVLDGHAETAELRDAATRAALDRIARAPGGDDRDGWAQLGELYVWMFTGEFTYTTGRIAWRDGSGAIVLLPALDFTAGDAVTLRTRGRYLLVASTAAGAYPRLYDLVEHRRVWSSDSARAVTFWP